MDSPSASAPVSYPAVMEQRYRSRLPAALVDLDSNFPMEDIAAAVVAGLTARGWDMHIIGAGAPAGRTAGSAAEPLPRPGVVRDACLTRNATC